MVTQASTPPKRWISSRLALLFAAAALLPYLLVRWLAGAWLADSQTELLLLLVTTGISSCCGLLIDRRTDKRMRRYRRAVRRLGHADFNRGAVETAAPREMLQIEIHHAAANLQQRLREYEEHADRRELEVSRLRAEVARLGSENMQKQSEILQLGKSVSSLQDFVVAINKMNDPAQIAGQLLTYVDNEVDYDIATVMLVDTERQELAAVAISNREKGSRLVGKYVRDIQSLQSVAVKSSVGRVMEAGNSLLIADIDADRRGLVSRNNICSELAVPLKVQDKVIGVVHLESSKPGTYTIEHEALLTLLANPTATAIVNLRLLEEEAKVRVLREMDRLKSQLISTVSHELRTPLAAIKGYSTSLQRPEGKLDENTRREFLEIIEEETDRLSAMIENLLDLSKIEAGVLHLHKQPVQIERIVRKVLDHAKRRHGEHRFRVRFPADCPSVVVAPHRIEQVVHNLVENAIKYSPEGGRIAVSGEVDQAYLVVSISDEGPGIPAEHVDRIFEPFYQVDSSTTRRVGGSGLGLAICRGFIDAHGGRIWVESTPGRGSTFKFSLPLGHEEEIAAAPDEVLRVGS